MTIFNLQERLPVWFDMDGGGRVQLKSLTGEEWKKIRDKVVKKKVEFKKVEGTPARLTYEDINEDLQNELFWDIIIVDWEKFFDSKGTPIPCTKENKILLVTKSAKFISFVTEKLKELNEEEEKEIKEDNANL